MSTVPWLDASILFLISFASTDRGEWLCIPVSILRLVFIFTVFFPHATARSPAPEQAAVPEPQSTTPGVRKNAHTPNDAANLLRLPSKMLAPEPGNHNLLETLDPSRPSQPRCKALHHSTGGQPNLPFVCVTGTIADGNQRRTGDVRPIAPCASRTVGWT